MVKMKIPYKQFKMFWKGTKPFKILKFDILVSKFNKWLRQPAMDRFVHEI